MDMVAVVGIAIWIVVSIIIGVFAHTWHTVVGIKKDTSDALEHLMELRKAVIKEETEK